MPASDEDTQTQMSDVLRTNGITLTEPDREENIPSDAEVVVIGNAIKRGNPEVEEVLNRKLY